MTLEIVGGILGSSIGTELADAGSRSLARIAKELTGELLEAPGDSVKFARLIKEGKVDEAYKAVRDNLIDDAGDVAGAAKFDEFRQRIIDAAAEEQLTEAQHLGKELAVGVLVETIEQYDRSTSKENTERQVSDSVPFSFFIDEQLEDFLVTRITDGSGLDDGDREFALAAIHEILNGNEPDNEEFRALEIAFGSKFVMAISRAGDIGLLKR